MCPLCLVTLLFLCDGDLIAQYTRDCEGFSGLATGAKLKMQLGLDDYMIYERSPDFGGTWWANVCEETHI